MSTQQTTVPTVENLTKSYKYFDLESLELKSEDVTVQFTPATNFADATARVGNDEKIIVSAVNDYLRSEVLKDARKAVMAKGASKKVVLLVAKPFRELAPYNQIKDRKEQTTAILNFFKSVPSILESIKNTPDTGDDSDTED